MNVPDLAHSTSDIEPLYPNYRVSCLDTEASCCNKPRDRTKEEKLEEEEEEEVWNPKIMRQLFSREKGPIQKTMRRIKVTDRAKKCTGLQELKPPLHPLSGQGLIYFERRGKLSHSLTRTTS